MKNILVELAITIYSKLSDASLEMCLLSSKLRCNSLSHFLILGGEIQSHAYSSTWEVLRLGSPAAQASLSTLAIIYG